MPPPQKDVRYWKRFVSADTLLGCGILTALFSVCGFLYSSLRTDIADLKIKSDRQIEQSSQILRDATKETATLYGKVDLMNAGLTAVNTSLGSKMDTLNNTLNNTLNVKIDTLNTSLNVKLDTLNTSINEKMDTLIRESRRRVR